MGYFRPAQVSLSKILKCADNDDSITVKADDDGDAVTFVFEGNNGDRVSDFELKLMDIDTDHLGIPDTNYKCTVKMPASDFQRIVRDMTVLGEACTYHTTAFCCRSLPCSYASLLTAVRMPRRSLRAGTFGITAHSYLAGVRTIFV